MDENSAHVLNGDPGWIVSEMMMWRESLPESVDQQAVDPAEKAVEKLDARSRETSWQADSLKLARDSTVAAQLLQHVDRDQNAETPQNGTRPLLYRFWRSISPNRGTPI